jgi:sigma-E factor negative regulatory protein RseC
MAFEEGVVFKMGAPGAGTAWVKTTRTNACESCSSRHACHAEEPGQAMEVEALNTADARVGDRIVLNISSTSLLKATFLLYVFPVLAMIAGAMLGQTVALRHAMNVSALSALFAFLSFGLAFLVIRIIGSQLAKDGRYQPEIIKIRGTRPLPADVSGLPRAES